MKSRSAEALTSREQEVIELLSNGLTNDEIARQLGISLAGVKYHVSGIFRRLRVTNRHEAALLHLGSEGGVLTPREEEVIELLSTGLTNEEIARQLGISLDGAKYHVSEILRRLKVESRREAASLHLRTARSGRLAALAPVMFLRKLPLRWLPTAAAGAVLTAVAVAIAVLAWGVMSTSTDAVTTTGCSIEQTAASAPNCARAAAAAGADAVTAISAGTFHSCALKDGGVWCWGAEYCCDGIFTAAIAPMAMPGLTSGVSALIGGDCAVKDGGVWCWGLNPDGEFGNNSRPDWPVPVAVSGLTSGVSAFIGGDCAVKDGGVWCWVQKNDGTYNAAPMPGLASGVSAISGTCAVKDGGAWCWGRNHDGQLGDNSTTDSDVPMAVSGLASGVSAISSGGDYVCAVMDGGAWCWGSNWGGKLGNRGTDSPVPVPVPGLVSGVSEISARSGYACAVKDGGVWCWGDNSKGQLGTNNTRDLCGLPPFFPCSLVPVPVSGLASGVSALIGDDCAVKDGGVWCWGGRTGAAPMPGLASGVSGVSAISVGYDHSCELKDDEVWCWGDNGYGQLGNVSPAHSDVPVRVQFTPPGAGDIAERPAAKPLSSQPATGSADHRTAYVLGATAAAALATVAAGVWAVRRRRIS